MIKICLDLYPFGGTCLEPYFRALLAKSRDREVPGSSQLRTREAERDEDQNSRAALVRSSGRSPRFQASEQFLTSRLDPDYISWVRTADPDALSAENERLLERIIGDFSDIPLTPIGAKAKPGGRTLSDVARPKLEAIHSVAVGKVAPDIDGEDIDGKPMKLSQYRGKVVVLVFWGTWCGPCMSLIPHEKALVERLRGRPFAAPRYQQRSRPPEVEIRPDGEGDHLAVVVGQGEAWWTNRNALGRAYLADCHHPRSRWGDPVSRASCHWRPEIAGRDGRFPVERNDAVTARPIGDEAGWNY